MLLFGHARRGMVSARLGPAGHGMAVHGPALQGKGGEHRTVLAPFA
jgi:hypothetical protein